MPIRYQIELAKRLYYSSQAKRRSSRPAIRVALGGIIIGVMVMIITLCVVVGFKQTITEKVAGFDSHIQILNFDNNNSYQTLPVSFSDSLIDQLSQIPDVQSVSKFATKPGMLKTDSAFQGIVLRATEDTTFVSANLVTGYLPTAPDEIVLSSYLASVLHLQVNDPIFCYFLDDNVRVRKFRITGIYSTDYLDYDRMFIFCQMDVVRQLNAWSADQQSGLELRVNDFHQVEPVADQVFTQVAYNTDKYGHNYYVQTIYDLNPQIFSWLELLDMNVIVVIILMLCVSGFNIVSGLVILILDGVQLIGMLKALGADNRFVRGVFIAQASMLVARGLLWGNMLGLALCLVQSFFHLLPLDAATYYVSYVPVAFPLLWLLLLNVGIMLLSFLIMILPSMIISRISPARVMHFE